MNLGPERRTLDDERLETRTDLLAIARGGRALFGDGELDDVHHHRLTLVAGQRDRCWGGVRRRR